MNTKKLIGIASAAMLALSLVATPAQAAGACVNACVDVVVDTNINVYTCFNSGIIIQVGLNNSVCHNGSGGELFQQ